MRYVVSILLLVSLLTTAKGQHTAIYSQYLTDGLVINPAYAGSRDVLSTSFSYRNQWVGFPGSPTTMMVGAHMPLRNKSIAIGLLLMDDKIGIQNNFSVFGNYAYRIRINSGMLALGLRAGIDLKNDTRYSVQDPGDYEFANNKSHTLPNFGFGVYFSNANYFFGVSIPELLSYRANKSSGFDPYNDPKNYNIMVTGGYLFHVNDFLKIKPSTLLRYSINSTIQYDLNVNAILINDGSLWVGTSYRAKDAIVALVGYQLNTQLWIGYSYDYTLSTISNFSSGSHELSIRYELRYIVKALNPRFF